MCSCSLRAKESFLKYDQKFQAIPYHLLLPKPLNGDKKFPLLLVLHGMGDDGASYLELWKDEAARHRSALLAPTLTRNFSNTEVDRRVIYDLIEHVTRKYPIDSSQIRIAGISAGGVLAQWLVTDSPQRWKDAALLSVPPMPETLPLQEAEPQTYPSILFVYGEKDDGISAEGVAAAADGLRNRGVQVGIIEDPDAGHEQRPDWARYIFKWFETHTLEAEPQSTQ